MSRFCPNCGRNLMEGANFCAECGISLAPLSAEEFRPDTTFGEMLFKADGRLNRLRYIKRILSLTILHSLLIVAVGFWLMHDKDSPPPEEIIYFNAIISFAALVPQFSWDVRRLHDLNKGAFLAVVDFLCSVVIAIGNYFGADSMRPDQLVAGIVGVLILLYLMFVRGTQGTNEYGGDPLGRVAQVKKVNWEMMTVSAMVAMIVLIFLLAQRLDSALQSL